MIDAFGPPTSSAAGDTAAEGYSGASARADHVHAREAADANLTSLAGNISQIDVGDSASAGALTVGARADHQHPLPIPAAPTTSAVGDSAATGSATTVARADHVHGREGFGGPVASAVGDSSSNGSATTVARSDHKHAREAFGGSPASVAATAVTGSATTVSHSDHAHALASLGSWTDFVPTITAGSGTLTAVTVNTCRYWQHGKTVTFYLDVSITTNGTGATDIRSTVPVAALHTFYGAGRETASTGALLSVEVSTNLIIRRYDNGYPGGSGTRIIGSVTYETA